MFSAQEESYLKGLIGSYCQEGYCYYLAHTVTESDNNYDMYIYFSKEEIKALTPTTFDLTNAILIKIDSSSRNDNSYNPSTHSRSIIAENNYTDIVSVNVAEFIYTNSNIDYDTSTSVVHPDILLNSFNITQTYTQRGILIVLIIIFLYTFICNILRLRK